MSILIKGMKMPKDGDWVNINICSDGSVYFIKSASNGFVFYGVRKGEAIEIPPHGRLIDADEAIGHLFNGEQCLYSWDEIEDAIDATETIIPAEEGE